MTNAVHPFVSDKVVRKHIQLVSQAGLANKAALLRESARPLPRTVSLIWKSVKTRGV